MFPEIDISAVPDRAPAVVLVDELAHTNTPGSGNDKRWQDVEELLAAGIEVISTVNVQHHESLNDVVGQTNRLLLAGRSLAAIDRPVLNAVANQAAGLVHRAELAEEANAAAALVEADRLRRALFSAVSHDLRTPLAGAKAAVSSLRSDEVEFSADDTAELLEAIEESVDQLRVISSGTEADVHESDRRAALASVLPSPPVSGVRTGR